MHPTGYRSSEILEIVSRAVIGLGSGQHPRLARVLADQADTEITEREALEEAATQVADSEAPRSVSALESLCTEMAGIDVSGITGAVTFPEVTAATQEEPDAGAGLVTIYADGAGREAQMFSGINLEEATALTVRERVEHAVAQVASQPRGACAAQEQTSEVSR